MESMDINVNLDNSDLDDVIRVQFVPGNRIGLWSPSLEVSCPSMDPIYPTMLDIPDSLDGIVTRVDDLVLTGAERFVFDVDIV